MEKNVLRAIDGIALYPLISFGIFGLFFVGLLAYVVLVKPEVVRAMEQLPLADGLPAAEPRKGGPVC